MSPTSYQAAPPRVIDTTRLAALLQPPQLQVHGLSCGSHSFGAPEHHHVNIGIQAGQTVVAQKERFSLHKWSYQLSCRSRQKKFDLFWHVLAPKPGSLMLNIGADPPLLGQKHYKQSEIDIEQPEQDERFGNLRIIGCNLIYNNMLQYERYYAGRGWHGIVADGCNLPFADKSIDVVFSNAVIEHVADQAQMAREIMRVGKKWFVTTPNFWYPIEVHCKMPLVHFLPRRLRHQLDVTFNLSVKGELINLLSARQFLRLFPNSRLEPVRVTFYPETLVVYGPIADI
jgi:SAM-dependent methyltransferase